MKIKSSRSISVALVASVFMLGLVSEADAQRGNRGGGAAAKGGGGFSREGSAAGGGFASGRGQRQGQASESRATAQQGRQ